MTEDGRFRLLIGMTGGLLVAMSRIAATPADVTAIMADPARLASNDIGLMLADASYRFDGGPIRFAPAPGR
jgi:hypothetical protein